MCLRRRILDAQIRNQKRYVDKSHAALERRLVLRIETEDRADARRDAAMQPCDRRAALVERGFQMLDRHGVVVAVLHIVFARPRQLHRRAVHRLRQERGFDDVIGFRFAPESAAEQRNVDGDVVER